jgi:hypothetical protein
MTQQSRRAKLAESQNPEVHQFHGSYRNPRIHCALELEPEMIQENEILPTEKAPTQEALPAELASSLVEILANAALQKRENRPGIFWDHSSASGRGLLGGLE